MSATVKKMRVGEPSWGHFIALLSTRTLMGTAHSDKQGITRYSVLSHERVRRGEAAVNAPGPLQAILPSIRTLFRAGAGVTVQGKIGKKRDENPLVRT